MFNALHCADILRKHYFSMDAICNLCNEEEENLDHLFLSCQLARSLWFGSNLTVKPQYLQQKSIQDWLRVWFNQ